MSIETSCFQLFFLTLYNLIDCLLCIHYGIHNARALLSEKRLDELEAEIEHTKWDIGCEVRRSGEQLWKLKSGQSYHADEENSPVGSTGFLIHKRHNSNIESSKNDRSTRVIYVIIRLNIRYRIKIIQV